MKEKKCDGVCVRYDECAGEVKSVQVSGLGFTEPFEFNYCETAIQVDKDRGFTVEIMGEETRGESATGVQGGNAGLEWKKGAPKERGSYLIVTKRFRFPTYMDEYNPAHPLWSRDELLWHIGPIPPAPQNDEP